MLESVDHIGHSELENKKNKLRENINKKSAITESDAFNLQKLLTFVEIPSFIKNNSKSHGLLPTISHKNFLVCQDPYLINENKKSYFMTSDNNLLSSKNRINCYELGNIIKIGIHIDKKLGYMSMKTEFAVGLRQLVYGSLKHSFSSDWRKSYFLFKDLKGELCYSLYSEKNCVRSLIVCVQCFILKHLLYSTDLSSENRAGKLKVTENKRLGCLINALTEILWKVGEQKKAFVCLSSDMKYIDSSPHYICDEITETIQIFKFKSYDSICRFLTKNIDYFTSSKHNGCILFLYSIVLSKGLQELLEEFEFDHSKSLLSTNETLTPSGINLILTGYATEFLHNGVQMPKISNESQISPQYGIKKRSEIGYLQYNSPKESDYDWYTKKENSRRFSDSQNAPSGMDIEQVYVVGSMLKTPNYPIWVINGDGNYGVLFCLRYDLLTHWRTENNFQLMYLNCLPSQSESCILSICTKRGRTAKFKTSLMLKEESKKIPILNRIINTKWFGCRITWNNCSPFI